MYKDKPYSYAASRKNTPLYRQWRVVAGGILSLLALLYWLRIGGSTRIETPEGLRKGKSTSWSWTGSAGAAVDWESRREAVKEAFILSWDGYEQYAWGMFGVGEDCCAFSLLVHHGSSANGERQQAPTYTIRYRKKDTN